MVTIRMVAERCGMSVAAVSRALNHRAGVAPEKAEEIRKIARQAYSVLGCRGLTRVDFLVERESGKVVLNEPNTLPGFTNISMYPKLMMAAGMSYSELITGLIELAEAEFSEE